LLPLYVQITDDVVTEQTNEGTDTVNSTVTFTLTDNIEKLTLTGATAINGTGNSLNNVLTGNAADNALDGKGGTDTLVGGQGDDTYYVDVISDQVTEKANEGTDTVNSAVAWTLGANFENLTLTGTTAIFGTGNSSNNVLTGNDRNNSLLGLNGDDVLSGGKGNNALDGGEGNDTLIGGVGTDTLTGGAGQDVFQFAGTNKATITDFSATDDRIVLDITAFTKLGRIGSLDSDAFCINTTGKAAEADDRIVYIVIPI